MHLKRVRGLGLERQIGRLNGRIQIWESQLDRLSQIRFFLFLAAFVISGAIFLWQGANLWGITFVPLFVPFIICVVLYNRLYQATERWKNWRQIKEGHLARMGLKWDDLPVPEDLTPFVEHPFGFDLDLVGARSLHHLMDTAVTQEGSQRLQNWLLTPLDTVEKIRQRQLLVAELTPMTLFRDKLTLSASRILNVEGKFPGRQLIAWLDKQEESEEIRPLLIGLSCLAVITGLLLLFSSQLPFSNLWLISLLIYLALYARGSGQHTRTLFQDATFLADQLETLDDVFQFIEESRLEQTPQIKKLCAPFFSQTNKPSTHIRKLRRVMAGVGLRQNPLLGFLINFAVPWDLFFAYLLRQRQAELKRLLPKWLTVWNELEALGSLANFAYLNEGLVVFPTFETENRAYFNAKLLAHPLISDEARVGNDFVVEGLGEVGIITGSNMAGKSSFLRTVGLNLVLAYAGGPVMASHFTTSLFRLYSSIRVNDSLQDGFSFFYAEVRRLKSILQAYEAEDKRPLFFLIDEIFRGTNNRERLIGSQSFIQAVASGRAVGLIATHDLELVKLADDNANIKNYHFRDDVADGKMVFDYLLRPGPSPTTNALKIMALAGLPVPLQTS